MKVKHNIQLDKTRISLIKEDEEYEEVLILKSLQERKNNEYNKKA